MTGKSSKHDPEHGHRHGTRADLAALKASLRKLTRKVTGARLAILEVLRTHPHPLANKQIFAALPKNTCDLATVYRSVQMLEKLGIVKRFDFGDGTARFEMACSDAECHHHHLICTKCDAVVEIEDCFPKELEQRIGRQHGFRQVTHRLEFFGICPEC